MRSLNVESLARDCKEPVEMRWAESRLECEESSAVCSRLFDTL